MRSCYNSETNAYAQEMTKNGMAVNSLRSAQGKITAQMSYQKMCGFQELVDHGSADKRMGLIYIYVCTGA